MSETSSGNGALLVTSQVVPPPPTGKGKRASPPHRGGGVFFSLGLASCVAIQSVVLQAPRVLPWLYVGQIIPLLIYRGITYHRQHWGHYTLELCYFCNSLLIVYICLFRGCDWLFIINFGLTSGPVLIANIVYRCSMVMSDIQRFISWYMHVIPGIVIFTIRWLQVDGFNPFLLLLLSIAACVIHSIIYHLYVWRLSPASSRNHPAYQNSFIYMSKQWTSGPLHAMLNCCGPALRCRIFSFALINQAFNLLSITLTYAAWYSLTFHLVLVLTVVFVTAYYAGSYYDHLAIKAEGSSQDASSKSAEKPSSSKVAPMSQSSAATPSVGAPEGAGAIRDTPSPLPA